VEIDLRRRARSRDFVRERAEAVPRRRIGIGKRQRRRRGIRFCLRRLGLRRSQADHAARDRGGSFRGHVAEEKIQIVPSGGGRGTRRGGIRRRESGGFGYAFAV